MRNSKPLTVEFVGGIFAAAQKALSDTKVRRKWADSHAGSPVTTVALCAEIARLNELLADKLNPAPSTSAQEAAE